MISQSSVLCWRASGQTNAGLHWLSVVIIEVFVIVLSSLLLSSYCIGEYQIVCGITLPLGNVTALSHVSDNTKCQVPRWALGFHGECTMQAWFGPSRPCSLLRETDKKTGCCNRACKVTHAVGAHRPSTGMLSRGIAVQDGFLEEGTSLVGPER